MDNVFPFGFGGELLTFSQLDELVEAILKNHVTRVFGQLRPEVVARLATLGFQKGETLPGSSVALLGTPCEPGNGRPRSPSARRLLRKPGPLRHPSSYSK